MATPSVSYMRKRNPSGQFEIIYPFGDLDIEDSFLVKTNKESPDFPRKYANIRSSAYIFSKRNTGIKFRCKQVANGVQVTRIS